MKEPLLRSLLMQLLIAAVVLTVAAVVLVVVNTIEGPWVTYTNQPFPTALKQVAAGDVMPLTVARCSKSDTTRAYVVTHELRSDDKRIRPFVLPSQLATVNPGCEEAISLINRVPECVPPGIYRVHGMGILEGRVQSWKVPWVSQPFEVVASGQVCPPKE